MKKLFNWIVAIVTMIPLCGLFSIVSAQNVGIGTNTPAEKLHVVGNMHLTGTIKPNGVTGMNNQVLMTNSSGNLVWGDLTDYKYSASITQDMTWTVPAGVTRVLIEAWGGGGGGASGGGGCGGNYVIGVVNVSPGAILTINIGGGGAPATTEAGSAVDGENTTVSGPSFSIITALGGNGATFNSPGYGSVLSSATPHAFVQYVGQSGRSTTFSYAQISGTVTYEIRNYGAGGSTAPYYSNGADGAVRVYNLTSGAIIKTTESVFSSWNGGGGAGGPRGANWGAGGNFGHVIIHY